MESRGDVVTFRTATIDDVPAIRRCRAADPEWGPADRRTGLYLEGKHHPGGALRPRALFLAIREEEVLGYIAGHRTRRHGCDGELQYLWVAPASRGLGTATELLQLLARWFLEQSAKRICVDVVPENIRARTFYARHGAHDLSPHWMVWDDISVCVGHSNANPTGGGSEQ